MPRVQRCFVFLPHYVTAMNITIKSKANYSGVWKGMLWLYLLDSSWHAYGTYSSKSIISQWSYATSRYLLSKGSSCIATHTGRTQICREGSHGRGIITSTNRANTVQSHSYNDTSSTSHQATTYCWCGGDVGRMITCDNPNCRMEWFHFECVGITHKPRGKWFCSDSCSEQIK